MAKPLFQLPPYLVSISQAKLASPWGGLLFLEFTLFSLIKQCSSVCSIKILQESFHYHYKPKKLQEGAYILHLSVCEKKHHLIKVNIMPHPTFEYLLPISPPDAGRHPKHYLTLPLILISASCLSVARRWTQVCSLSLAFPFFPRIDSDIHSWYSSNWKCLQVSFPPLQSSDGRRAPPLRIRPGALQILDRRTCIATPPPSPCLPVQTEVDGGSTPGPRRCPRGQLSIPHQVLQPRSPSSRGAG